MSKRIQAFTLVELLVALAITSVLIVLLVNVVAAALNVWQQGRNQIDTTSNARQALGRIADEIKGAMASANQVEFSENVAFSPGPSPVPKTSENVFFVAPYPNISAGDLCVIAYRHNAITRELQRAFKESQSAWSPGAATRYRVAGYNFTTADWRTVANGVLEFEVQSYSQQNLDSASPSPSPADSWNSVAGASPMLGNTPRAVVLRIKVVDDKTLTRLTGLSSGNPTYDRLVNQAAREFTTSVTLLPPH